MLLYASDKEIGKTHFLNRTSFGERQKQDARDEAIPLISKQNDFSITSVDAHYKTVTMGAEFINISYLD